jgi:hypothetical protein
MVLGLWRLVQRLYPALVFRKVLSPVLRFHSSILASRTSFGGGLVDHPEEELFLQVDLGGGAHGSAFVTVHATVQQYNFLFFLT